MNNVFLALAGLALAGAVPAAAQQPSAAPPTAKAAPAKAPAAKARPKSAATAAKSKNAKTGNAKTGKAKAAKPKVAADGQAAPERKAREPSAAAARVAAWIASSGDNQSLPYIIVDKQAAAAFLFDATGKPMADAPVLVGIAQGDDATPGIGAKSLSEIGPAEKTTPAGRFLAKFGLAAGKQRVLWVDYATSVALHTIPPANKEQRRARMLSPEIDDNRITFGCINVPMAFYNKGVRPLFAKKGGYVYVLPDSKPLEEVFPRLHVQPFLGTATS